MTDYEWKRLVNLEKIERKKKRIAKKLRKKRKKIRKIRRKRIEMDLDEPYLSTEMPADRLTRRKKIK